MENKTINHLVLATVDSLKNFKRTLGSTALATTLVATSIFTGLTGTAEAGAVQQGTGAKNTYADGDSITLTAATAQTVLAGADELTSMINSDGTAAVYSLSGAFELDFTGATFSLKATEGESLTVNMATSGGSIDLGEATLGTVIINTAAGAIVDLTAADTHTLAMDGSAAFAGIMHVNATSTLSGTIGSTNGIAAINVATSTVGTFSETVKATTITLTGDAVFAKAVTATDIALVAGKATFNNTVAVSTAAAITETSGATELAVLNSADAEAASVASFTGAITVDTITIGATATGGSAKATAASAGALTVHGGNAAVEDSQFESTSTHTGAVVLTQAGSGDAIFKLGGTTSEVVGAITATSDGDGGIVVAATTNATFDAVGTDAAKLKTATVNASSVATFGAAVAADTLTINGTATLQAIANESEAVVMGANGVLFIDKTITNGQIVINEVDTARPTLAAGSKIYLPENLSNGQTLILFDEQATAALADHATTITETNAALQDTALINYVAAAGDGTNLVVTASDKADATTASELSVTVNAAKALRQALTAAISDTNVDGTLEDIFNDALNGVNGETATSDTALALQVAPQTDTISGSAVATRAMTGTVQGIVSNRMASLRSGDAFVTGMSAGNGMTANSGFIQAFGSETQQKNTGSTSSTIYGYDSDTSGVAIGFDGVTDTGETIGLSASFSSSDVEGKGTGKSKNSIDSYTVSVYADKATENGYLEGSLTFGVNDHTSSRLVNVSGLSRTYAGNYDSEQISLKVGGGSPNEVKDGTFVTPFATATGTLITTDSYTETSTTASDNLRLRIVQDDINSLVGTVGVKAHMITDKGTPMISFAINNEFGDTTINSTNTYQGGGTAFVTSTDVEELSATLGLGYSFGNDVTSLNVNYEANANEDDYLSHYGTVKIIAKF